MTKRIVHCLRAPVGGLFRHVRDLASEQAARGNDVGVICDAIANDPLTEARLTQLSQHLTLGLKRTAMPRAMGPGDLAAFRDGRAFAKSTGADIIHGHGAKGGAYARMAARSLVRAGGSIGCYYTPHGGSLHYHPSSLKGRVYMAAERTLARHTDGIIFESAYSSRIFSAQVGTAPCRTRVIPNGLLPHEFTEHYPAGDAANFLFVGELRHLKGVDILLHALAHVRRKHEATAFIVGDGPDGDDFKALANELGLAGAVTFPGAMPARDAFKMGHALIMPSRAESFPYIVLEAAAAGLPLYATNVGGIPEIVEGTGVELIAPDNVAALSAAMRGFLTNRATAAKRARALKARVGELFTVSAMADAIDDFYGDF